MTRALLVLALSAAGLTLTAGDAAAFGGRRKADCAAPCPTPCAAPRPAPCPAPCVAPVVHHCAPACPAPCAAPAPVCCDPCAKPARVGLFKKLFSRGGKCGC